MIRRLDFRTVTPEDWATALPRAEFDVHRALDVVHPVIDDVRERGADAVIEYGERFDHVRAESLAVPAHVISSALRDLDPTIRAGLEESIRRIRATCEAEVERTVTTEVAPGAMVERRMVAIQRVGLYVPGGLAPLVSTVVMNAVPAQVAGVEQIALTSPPQAEFGGWPHPTILAACGILGIDEVYAAGGAQAVAMFAYGAGACEPVNLVTGPGNIYVAAAKRHVQGTVAIDSEAGPTEIAILADDSADATYIAADLISQAEHDPLAGSVLVTDSEALASAVEAELDDRVAATKHADRVRTALDGVQSAIVLVADLEQGLAVVNAYAAEHLEIQTRSAAKVAAGVTNAGAVFVGPWSPVSLGDYAAGSNHVLPTGGCACHSSGLSVRAFVKNMQVVTYSRDALAEVAPHVERLADAEDLPAHGAAVAARFGDGA